jgi:cyclopropane-fatty-acyl-phospholipid synthase
LGFAEAYINGDVACSDLTQLFRFFVRNRAGLLQSNRGLFKVRLGDRIGHLTRRNSRMGSRRNISEHYDLGNDFYRLWLDGEMNYSSAFFAGGAPSLEAAQTAKLDLVLEVLGPSTGATILEIGCGWGAFARRAARVCDAHVTGITLSHAQLVHARKKAAKENLSRQCVVTLQDYRDVAGSYDHIVSIEMIEAVGHDYWPSYFRVLSERLKSGGTAAIQAITIDEARFERYRRSADFIQRYIFPGGMLPTVNIIRDQAMRAGLALERIEHFGQCYARTLREWRLRFDEAWPQIGKLGFDDQFRRKWRYYLAYCEAGFLENAIDVGIYRLRKA